MSTKKVVLISSDDQSFEVDEAIAREFQTITYSINDGRSDGGIRLPNVTGEILSMVIVYCRKHVEEPDADHKDWDSTFVEVDDHILFDLILAANYLDIKSLLDLTCQKVADMVKGKSPEEIRKIFNIQNDFTPEEEEEIRRENRWVFRQ